jgi:transposase
MVLEEQLEAAEVATRLGVDADDLKRWVKTEQQKKSSKDQESMKELLLLAKKQEEEIRKLKMEREILKKAMAYFMPGQN